MRKKNPHLSAGHLIRDDFWGSCVTWMFVKRDELLQFVMETLNKAIEKTESHFQGNDPNSWCMATDFAIVLTGHVHV